MSSFQGPGTGISGTSNQFQVGYAQGAGYTSGNIAGGSPQAGYANQAAATTANLQLTSAGGSTWGWQGQQSSPSHMWGSNQGTSHTVFGTSSLQTSYSGYAGSTGNVNGYAPQAGYANQSAATSQTLQVQGIGSATWGWQGQSSNPSHLWGSNQGNVETVFNPGALQVSYAANSGSSANINAYCASAGYANQSVGNANGGVPQAGYANKATATAQTLQIQGTGSSTWHWQGQGGIPNHYWGSNDGLNMYVWQGNQGYAGYAGSTGNVNQQAASAYHAGTANTNFGNVNGYCGIAQFAYTTASIQGQNGGCRVWRNSYSGNSQGVSQYQGAGYGNIGMVVSGIQGNNTGVNISAAGVSTYSSQFGIQGNYMALQQIGAGFAMVYP